MGDKYVLRITKTNVRLCERHKSISGNEYTRIIGNYSDVQKAVLSALEIEMRQSPDTAAKAVEKAFLQFENDLRAKKDAPKSANQKSYTNNNRKRLPSQHALILEYIGTNGSITSMDGFRIGITKVTTRISELRRMGYHITAEWENSGTSRYCRYRLED